MAVKKKDSGVITKVCYPKIAVFAGSFDPFTLGHLDLVKRASALFDQVWVLVAVNASKKYLFSEDARGQMIQSAVEDLPNVGVAAYDGLTVDFMKAVGSKFLVRGVRNAMDMDYEQSNAWNNKVLHPDCETVFLSSAPEHLAVSSTVVRELLKCNILETEGGKEKLLKYVPASILPTMIKEFEKLK